MSFIEELKWRGMLQDITPGLEEEMEKGSIVGYIGYDPTAPSLTIGNLVTIMLLKHLQLAGHRPIVLIGGATGRIGDPSGKDKERTLLELDTLNENIERFKLQFGKFLDFEGPNAAIMLNNYDFYANMSIFEFLRDIGKNLTVNYMMSKDSVKSRIASESGISFTEFSYQLIQGYDFQHLYKNNNCILQMGGGDQWGNITTGTELIRKSGGKGYALTCPLLMNAQGVKFGKSEAGNVWLAPDMTSPYKFYQFWLNVLDLDLPKLFRMFSLRSKEEIEALEAEHTNPNELKRLLAAELTERVHSKADLESVERATAIAFNPKLEEDFLRSLSVEELTMVSEELVSFNFDKKALEVGVNIVDLLVGNHEDLKSKGDVKRAIKGGAIAVNTVKVDNEELIVNADSLLHGKFIFLQNGKKKKFLLVAE